MPNIRCGGGIGLVWLDFPTESGLCRFLKQCSDFQKWKFRKFQICVFWMFRWFEISKVSKFVFEHCCALSLRVKHKHRVSLLPKVKAKQKHRASLALMLSCSEISVMSVIVISEISEGSKFIFEPCCDSFVSVEISEIYVISFFGNLNIRHCIIAKE
jgi:hypothetical protein